nr:uncharacterized protein LOC122321628 [Drosophila bipectinata]
MILYVPASIEAPVLARIADAIVNQPRTGKYENLKSCILERFCESEQKKIQKLISETDLGDKRPTQLLNELNALAANKVQESFLKALWLQRLPTQVQAILQESDASLANLAKLADKVMEVGDFHQVRTIDAMSAPTSSAVSDDRLDRIEQQINALFRNRSRKNSLRTDRNSVIAGDMCSNKQLYCHVANNHTRPFVSKCLRQTVVKALHSLSHPGVKATNKLVGKHYVWPRMAKDVAKIVRSCIPCQKAKIQRHTKSPLGEYTASDARFEHINIDIVGPLPSSNGYRYCLTCIDRFSRWPAAIPLVDITAQSVANALISGWFAQYGIPLHITTDLGRQFESTLFQELTKNFGVLSTFGRRRTTRKPMV